LDTLKSKRQQILKSKLANIKPNDDNPTIEEMSDEEFKEMFLKKKMSSSSSSSSGVASSSSSSSGESEEENIAAASATTSGSGGSSIEDIISASSLDIDTLFSRDYIPNLKTKRSSGSFGSRSDDDDDTSPFFFGEDSDGDDSSEKKGDTTTPLFVDWAADYDDENEFHIPNRIGFTTIDWANVKKGFVNGKLKKKDRKMGKFNQSDLKVSCSGRSRSSRSCLMFSYLCVCLGDVRV